MKEIRREDLKLLEPAKNQKDSFYHKLLEKKDLQDKGCKVKLHLLSPIQQSINKQGVYTSTRVFFSRGRYTLQFISISMLLLSASH
jgi:hypothetical protein